jgi:hypothetical protein
MTKAMFVCAAGLYVFPREIGYQVVALADCNNVMPLQILAVLLAKRSRASKLPENLFRRYAFDFACTISGKPLFRLFQPDAVNFRIRFIEAMQNLINQIETFRRIELQCLCDDFLFSHVYLLQWKLQVF